MALNNRVELDATLSVIKAKMGGTADISRPADFASSLTAECFSTFLRVTAIAGKERAREIGSNGRVREFIKHACGDYSDFYHSLEIDQNLVFHFPRFPTQPLFAAPPSQ